MAAVDLLSLYKSTTKIRVAEARDIPAHEVNYFDRESKFVKGFTNYQEFKKTNFTQDGQNYYDNLRVSLVIPESFNPADKGIDLNRWGPGNGYYNPGKTSN